MRFSETIVVITGVSDRGIGAAIADQLAAEGATIVLWGLETPMRLLKRLERRKIPHQFSKCDVRNQNEVESARSRLLETFGKIDVLINNAGVEFNIPVEQMSDLDWDIQLEVNLTGAMRVTRSCLPYLSQPGGVVVNISSVLGLAGGAGYAAYSASKAGLIGFTQSLSIELATHQQRAVCVAPALVMTPMTSKHIENLDRDSILRILQQHPLGLGAPADVAEAVCFLASEQARWITGITMPLGWLPQFNILPNQLSEVAQQQYQMITGHQLNSLNAMLQLAEG